MQRALLAVAGAVALCGVCYLLLRAYAATGASVEDIVLLTCGATLALALIATAFSARALLRSNAVHHDLALLARSVDGAMRDLSARGERETASIGELNQLVTRELELFSSRMPVRQKQTGSDMSPARDNIVALQPSRRPRLESNEAPVTAAAAEQAGFELAVQRAFFAGPPDLSLQPIVSISQGAATGFEVFVHLSRDDSMSVDLQRLPASLPSLSQAAFERWLVLGALRAVGKQMGELAEALPLHCQISEALLTDADELNTIVEALRLSRKPAQAMVLSLPAALLEKNKRHTDAVDLLVETGVRLSAEGWSGNKDALEKMKRGGVCLLKLSADRLLGRVKMAKATNTAIRLVEVASALDVPVIAINVGNDEDAVSLIDLGINLMTGNRFSGPRRLKPQGEGKADRVASL